MKPALWLAVALAAAPAAAAPARDATAVALDRCLNDAAKASTGGQTGCETAAARAYDQRMNAAYAALLRALPAPAGRQLRQAQRAWLGFRAAETAASGALFATRRGTMYVPMQAGAATNLTRDRALQLEAYLRVMRIED